MSDLAPNNDRSTDRQAWTLAELARLERMAPGKPRQPALLEAFPGRTISAIRLQLHHARRRLGISLAPPTPLQTRDIGTTMLAPDDPGVPDTWHHRWQEKAAQSNRDFLSAMRRAA